MEQFATTRSKHLPARKQISNDVVVGERPKNRKMYNFIPHNDRAKNKKFSKVFCIGLNKTGTTSLHCAFQKLGLTSFHGGTYDSRIDAFSDGRYYKQFKIFDKQIPNCKFILNTRNVEDWVESRKKHCLAGHKIPDFPNDCRCDAERIKEWIQQRDQLHAQIIDYFKDRPSDLLIFDVCAGDGYKKLSNFLGLDSVGLPFPHQNSR